MEDTRLDLRLIPGPLLVALAVCDPLERTPCSRRWLYIACLPQSG